MQHAPMRKMSEIQNAAVAPEHGNQRDTPAYSKALREWLDCLHASLHNGAFAKLTLGHYTGSEAGLKSIQARRVVIKRQEMLSFTYRYKTRDIIKNAGIDDINRRLVEAFDGGFRTGTLFTTAADITYERPERGLDLLRRSSASQLEVPPLTHDHTKNRLISDLTKPYLQALAITDKNGSVLKAAQDKYRQINRYVELLAPLITEDMHKVTDMGCGKGYLTFALYDYMTAVRRLPAQITGVEQRADLVALCEATAVKSGFDGLHFVKGSIRDYDATGVNVLIALHACDTATDEAIAKGIAAGADLIVVAPCCHKQIRREMEKGSNASNDDFILKYGIFMERQAEMVTDAIRALILECYGYKTKVFEFISDVHTPKNVMITGRRDPAANIRSATLLQKIDEAKARFGIETHYLETLLTP